jgi:hypothetical protein
MDLHKFFVAGITEVKNIVVASKVAPLGRSQIRSQRGRAPPPRATRGRKSPTKSPVKSSVQKPGLVHGLGRGGRKNPEGTFWINKKGFVVCTDSSGTNKFKGVGWRDYCPTASFIGRDAAGLKMRCGCDSGEVSAATIIQKYARRMIVLNTVETPTDTRYECQPCWIAGASSSEEETDSDEEELQVFRETYGLEGRRTDLCLTGGVPSGDGILWDPALESLYSLRGNLWS